jgi:O-antigen/teichoic acid export membrane protein
MNTFIEKASPQAADEFVSVPPAAPAGVSPATKPRGIFSFELPDKKRWKPFGYSLADQALVVGGTLLVNVLLARTQSKSEYGRFALSYSVFTFLAGLHNAAILEPYTVFGAGRHRRRFPEYLRFMTRSHAAVGLLLTTGLLGACILLRWLAPGWVTSALVGLGLTVGLLLSGAFLRRVFYVQGRASLAAGTSLVFFLVLVSGVWVTVRLGALNDFSAYLIPALGWTAAGAVFAGKLRSGKAEQSFLELQPDYWCGHLKYTRWVFASALAIQLSTQSYYWLVAGLLSVKAVAELRAIYLLVAPVDQIFIALNYLVLPALAAHYASGKMGKFFSLGWRFGVAATGISALFAVTVRLAGKSVLHVLYAGRFDSLAGPLYLLALLPLAMAIGNTINDALKAAERPKLIFYAYLASGAATVCAGIPLVMRYGVRGAVLGVLVSAAAYTTALIVGFLATFSGEASAVARATGD